MIDTTKIGRRIAALRKERGLTGEAFAELLDVSPQAVSKWENGKNLPETALLPALSRALGVSIDSILLPREEACRIRPKAKIAAYTGAGWPHSNAYPALFAAAALFYGRETRRNKQGEQINDDAQYHLQNALTSEAFGVQYSELFTSDCLERSLGVYGLQPRVIDCADLDEPRVRDLVCDAISNGTPVILEPKEYADLLFAFGYEEAGKVLCCCAFLDGADERNCAYDFAKPRALRSRTAHVRRLVILEESGGALDLPTACMQALRHGLQMMTGPCDAMDFARLRGAGRGLYDAWIALLTQANEECSEEFYMAFPVFPLFIILYENRLHLSEFLKEVVQMNHGNPMLPQVQKRCAELAALAWEATQISCECWNTPEVRVMTNNERRGLLIGLLERCRDLEREMAEWLQGMFAAMQP
ncbi:MAG: helix-turn-helix transcriptional regulator [Oscillospiraceae bacterium]|nr:helix-turn-helix transcriptional regulator [Oscillospiraceae bacterium]